MLRLLFPAFSLLALPIALFAQTTTIPPQVLRLVGVISTTILNPIIAILFALGMASFMYGIALYIWNPDNEELREKGRSNMLWGVTGMFIMVSVFGIMRFLISSIGAGAGVMNYV